MRQFNQVTLTMIAIWLIAVAVILVGTDSGRFKSTGATLFADEIVSALRR